MDFWNFACTECSYVYRPAFGEEEAEVPEGTLFDALPETFECPSCGASKDAFFWIPQAVNEWSDRRDPPEAEICHTPFFHFTEGWVEVRVGSDDSPHPDENGHFVEWVALFDEDGDAMGWKFRPGGDPVTFEGFEEGDFFEIRASCVLHGVWKWVPDPEA